MKRHTRVSVESQGSFYSGVYEEIFQNEDHEEDERNKLGTINGCFVPCLLNILGVILFLRLGWAIGQAGVIGTIIFFVLAEFMTIMTVFSLTAIVTNGNMKGGGSYYMISRSLGPELGGAIGLLFYLAYAVGTTFYTIGFAEEIQSTWFENNDWPMLQTLIGSVVLFFVLIISLLGAGFFTKINVFIFVIQFGSIVYGLFSLWLVKEKELNGGGYHLPMSWELFKENFNFDFVYSDKCEYQTCTFRLFFSIVFPAATGIMEGANLSGDLKDPQKSIGKGTLMAIFASIFVYFTLFMSMAASFERDTLRNNMNVLQDTAAVPELVVIGVLISTSSSALGSVFGGSRVLQALARDDLFPGMKWLGKGSQKGDEPRRAVLFTWLIAQACLFMGNLDSVAPIITSFFCLSYAITNFSALALKASGTPNFRPAFKYFNSYTATLGGVCNIIVMFWLKVEYAVVALIFLVAIFIFLSYRTPNVWWGDISHAIVFHQVRKYLLRLRNSFSSIQTANFGGPQNLILLTDKPPADSHLVRICDGLKKGGLYIISSLLIGDYSELSEDRSMLYHEWLTDIDTMGVKGFPQIGIASTFRSGFQNLLLLSGLGALQPKTVVIPLIEFNEEEKEQEISRLQSFSLSHTLRGPDEYVSVLRDTIEVGKNLIVASVNDSLLEPHFDPSVNTVDVWLTLPESTFSWDNFESDGSLQLIQFACIMSVKLELPMNVYRTIPVSSRDHSVDADLEEMRLELLLQESQTLERVSSQSIVELVDENPSCEELNEQIREMSRNAALVFVSLPDLSEENFLSEMYTLVNDLPDVFALQVPPADKQ